jgi:vacuolar iron transporter family protein
MLAAAYRLPEAVRSPLKTAASTLACFALCGAVPLLPFLVEAPAASQLSIGMTALAFFLIESTKSRWSRLSRWRSGSETPAIGLAPQRAPPPPVTLPGSWSEPAAGCR